MPRELITVQVGQCGMQLGTRFWDLAMREHAQAMASQSGGSSSATSPGSAVFDEALSSFFRNVQPSRTGRGPGLEVPVGDGQQPIYSLRARAVCVDMEEGVLNEVKRGPLGELFDENQFIRDVSGSGNNWAHGHNVYGPQYGEAILESVRGVAERCDSLQSFFLMHSLGGGTGSGLGTYILEQLADAFPDVYRFNVGVFPSGQEDVVTSPYNSVLALNQLRQYSDCVLPLDNQALIDVCSRIDKHREASSSSSSSSSSTESKSMLGAVPDLRNQKPTVASTLVPEHSKVGPGQPGSRGATARLRAFDDMNSIGAHLLTSLTASIRFPGALNVDLNEITMNLVPYPRMHFLVSALSPLYTLANAKVQPRSLDQMFGDVLHPEFQLLSVAPKASTYLACGLFARGGGIQVSDLQRNVAKIKSQVRMAAWNSDGFKIGLCSVPPVGLKQSVLALSNNCCVRELFSSMRERFLRLYSRQAHLHHYTKYCEKAVFDDAFDGISTLIDDYALAEAPRPTNSKPRLNALG